ncbi:MAG: hypothetical protein ABI821_14485 [Pseudomonadota bacterium]
MSAVRKWYYSGTQVVDQRGAQARKAYDEAGSWQVRAACRFRQQLDVLSVKEALHAAEKRFDGVGETGEVFRLSGEPASARLPRANHNSISSL